MLSGSAQAGVCATLHGEMQTGPSRFPTHWNSHAGAGGACTAGVPLSVLSRTGHLTFRSPLHALGCDTEGDRKSPRCGVPSYPFEDRCMCQTSGEGSSSLQGGAFGRVIREARLLPGVCSSCCTCSGDVVRKAFPPALSFQLGVGLQPSPFCLQGQQAGVPASGTIHHRGVCGGGSRLSWVGRRQASRSIGSGQLPQNFAALFSWEAACRALASG